MRKITFSEATREAMAEEMEKSEFMMLIFLSLCCFFSC